MVCFVYILFCDQKKYYVGFTDNLKRRIKEHKEKESQFTRKFSDLSLVYYEEFNNRNVAVDREKQLKGWSKAKKEALIEGNKQTLVIFKQKH